MSPIPTSHDRPRDLREALSAYIDGELDPAEVAEVEQALARDPALRAEHEELLAAVELVRARGPVDAPPGFHARVVEATAALPDPGGLLVRLRRALGGFTIETLAVAVAALLVAVAISEDPEDPAPPAAPPALAELPQPALAPAEPAPPPPGPPVEAVEVAKADAQAPPTPLQERGEVLESLLGAAGEAGEDGVVAVAPAEAGRGGEPAAWGDVSEGLGAMLGAPLSLSLETADPAALLQLQRLAEELGGRALAPGGAPLEARRLGATPEQLRLTLRVPAHAVSRLVGEAARVGAVRVQGQRDDLLHGDGDIDVAMELRYRP